MLFRANVCFNIFKEWQETLCIPKRRVRRGQQSTKPLWWKPKVGRVIEERQTAYRRSKRHRTEVNVMAHVNACRAAKRIVRRAKHNKEEQVALDAKRIPKAFYFYINDQRICRESIGPLVDPGGNLVSDEAGTATLLNNHFAYVFTVENTDKLPRLDAAQADAADHAGATLDTVQFTSVIVEEKLGELEVHKSVSPDNMHSKVLKELKGCLSACLQDIFTRSMATVEIPDEGKIANMTGIYKKGGREIGGNYRPISLTSVVCKTMERIICDTLIDYLEYHQLILLTQHGFRHRRSCLTNLLKFFGEVYQEYDECKAVDLIYFDFQKAFDKVPLERFLLKVLMSQSCDNNFNKLAEWSDRKMMPFDTS